jgi:GDP-L-fucose synthase
LAGTCENDLINIGAGQEFSIRHFARLICEQVGYDFDSIQFDTTRYVGARSKCLSTGKLLGLISDLQLTPLETGLARTIEWFQRENPAVLAKAPQ